MKIALFLISTIAVLAVNGLILAEESLEKTQSSNKSLIPPEGNIYRFQSKTAWGQLNVLIREFSDYFKVEVKSDALASGWIFKNAKTNRTILKGGLNSVNQFQFQINQVFQNTFHLTVFLSSDREQIPVVIHLSAKPENKPEAVPTETIEVFQENQNHPYNSMVNGLYDKAVRDYMSGDNFSALANLRKAEKLDPTQTQIKSLIQKIASLSNGHSENLLTEAQTALKKGSKEEALAKILDYLDEHPNDEKGLELKSQIEDSDNFSSAKKKTRTKNTPSKNPSKKADVEKSKKIIQNTEDSQAQADQVYNLGLDSYRKSDYTAAKKFWEQTLQIQPNHTQAQRNLQRLKDEHPSLP